jgi:hypothetical protein
VIIFFYSDSELDWLANQSFQQGLETTLQAAAPDALQHNVVEHFVEEHQQQERDIKPHHSVEYQHNKHRVEKDILEPSTSAKYLKRYICGCLRGYVLLFFYYMYFV